MNTNSFNIQNVIRLTKNRIIESKRKLLLQALLYYGIILCIGFFWLSITNNDLPYIIMYTGFLIFFFAVNTDVPCPVCGVFLKLQNPGACNFNWFILAVKSYFSLDICCSAFEHTENSLIFCHIEENLIHWFLSPVN